MRRLMCDRYISKNTSIRTRMSVKSNSYLIGVSRSIGRSQAEDPDMRVLYEAKKKSDKRPDWNTVSGESPTCKAYYHEWKRIEMWKDVLYRRWENFDGSVTRMQLIVPRALQQTMCREVHDGRAATHMGKRRVLRILSKYFFWYKMDKDVNWWIRTCDVCQRRKRPTKEPKAPMTKYVSGFPNERVAMDVMGPFIKSKNGNRYVLCMTDHFSKFSRAFAIPDQVAERVAKLFVREWVYMWGEPLSLHTDRGSNFESELMTQVCKLLHVSKTRTTAYHPQGNAQVERYNQTIADIVAKLTDKEEFTDWDEQLPIAVSAYNATEHSTTGFTPNKLMFNRELMHNFDKMLPESANKEELETWDDYVRLMDDQTRRAFQVARETIGRNVLLQKKHYDRTANLIKYKVGDPIMIRDHRLFMESGTRKLANKYDGPYYVLDVLSDVNFRIAKSSDDKPQIMHHDRMKLIEERTEANLDWVFKQSRSMQQNKVNHNEISETMREVIDRLTKLENKSKESKRKYRKRGNKDDQPPDERKEENPVRLRKPGRPTKGQNFTKRRSCAQIRENSKEESQQIKVIRTENI